MERLVVFHKITYTSLLEKLTDNFFQLLPGVRIEEFTERRKKLMHSLFSDSLTTYEEPKHHVVIIPAFTKTYMTERIPYIFRQNTDFLYLSGCLEPDTALIMTGSSEKNFKSTLFLRKQDAHSAKWDGPRTGNKDCILSFFNLTFYFKMK